MTCPDERRLPSGESGQMDAVQGHLPDLEDVADEHPVDQHQHRDVCEAELRADSRRPDLDAYGYRCAHAESVHRL